jgi:death-on-curing protein
MRYVTVDELIYINEALPGGHVRTSLQGRQRVRDIDMLEAAAGRPQQSVFGADAYPTLAEKAAALLHAITRNHPFADGNKRTATIGMIFMLRANGQQPVWDREQALEMIVSVAEGRVTLADFAAWLPTVPADPLPDPDADGDAAAIDATMTTHRWLLDELAKR